MNGYTNIIYLAAAVLVVFAAILVIHFIAGSKRNGAQPQAHPPLLRRGVPCGRRRSCVFGAQRAEQRHNRRLQPFGPSELSRAGILLSEPVSDSGSLDSEVYISGMNLAFNDGKFLDIRFDAFCSGEQRPFQVTGSGKLYPGLAPTLRQSRRTPSPCPSCSLRSCSLRAQAGSTSSVCLTAAPWCSALRSTALRPPPGGSTYLLRNDELLPVKGHGQHQAPDARVHRRRAVRLHLSRRSPVKNARNPPGLKRPGGFSCQATDTPYRKYTGVRL